MNSSALSSNGRNSLSNPNYILRSFLVIYCPPPSLRFLNNRSNPSYYCLCTFNELRSILLDLSVYIIQFLWGFWG
jgi:hypothetical protein